MYVRVARPEEVRVSQPMAARRRKEVLVAVEGKRMSRLLGRIR
jgi:predicted RNA-binding protein YlqC (UPF0109 family)